MVIITLYEKRKKAHEAALREMERRRKETNDEIEEKIIRKSGRVTAKLTEISEETDYNIFLILHTKEHVSTEPHNPTGAIPQCIFSRNSLNFPETSSRR